MGTFLKVEFKTRTELLTIKWFHKAVDRVDESDLSRVRGVCKSDLTHVKKVIASCLYRHLVVVTVYILPTPREGNLSVFPTATNRKQETNQ